MRISKLFTKTTKNSPADETSLNAILLERAGYIMKSSAGIYSYLPLGLIVIENIKNIVRKNMNETGAQEIYMPALLDKKYLEKTGREKLDVGFEAVDKESQQPAYILSWTHEEVATDIATHFISSYRDLPLSIYQFQTKFRNEKRAKSGLLRGREFTMKDMYSFHADEADFWQYYENVKKAYVKTFSDCDLKAYTTEAAGGDFTLNKTHEFQVLTDIGEDTIFYCGECNNAINSEVVSSDENLEGKACTFCKEGTFLKSNGVEVGNIFPLGTKYADAIGLKYLDESGASVPVIMGSYGIGIGRLMGMIVEIHNDERGIIWPKSVAPFDIHLVALEGGMEEGEKIYQNLTKNGFKVLFDDRTDKMAGEKFADADLLGMPWRIIISHRTLDKNEVEVKARKDAKDKSQNVNIAELIDFLQ